MDRDATDKSTLVVFFKAPHRSKRRLAQAVGEAAAAAAAEQLLRCAVEDACEWLGPVVFAPARDADAAWLKRASGRPFELVVQAGSSLGERINHVDRVLRSRGRRRLIYIGADCPGIDGAYLARADAALESVDAVLGPAADGGVVLMAARRGWPGLGDLPWSTAELNAALERRLAERHWTLASLETLADVDELADLALVGARLAGDARPARIALLDWLRAREAELSAAS